MSRYTGSVCRQCRRENMKLFLKGDRCFSDKCSFDRRGYPPGEHGQKRVKVSDYGMQLREKQKVRRIYGISEKQFRITFKRADREKGITGTNLLSLLETRLDNTVFRMGFVNSRNQGRHFVRHQHFTVNGKKVNIPSYQVKKGDVIALREKSRKIQAISDSLEAIVRRGIPQWLEIDKEKFKGEVVSIPAREDITLPIQEQLIVELYSK
ncbi:MAG: 30S ribosomal protein S4 [Desulfotignum sp.]|nr:30S ribosomal protein S4 [Desulfotignum sp.]MCF8112400.1 30S ribosomal protein S4 [Desulfotignum sp.]MCF8125232.1 30S ribosomal protein S4 [Desulfotignum sp.]